MGTLYVARSALFFYVSNRLVGGEITIRLSDVNNLVSTSSLLGVAALSLETYASSYFFTNFLHRASAAALISHVMQATHAPKTFLHRKLIVANDFQSGLLTGGTALRGRLLGKKQDESVLVNRLRTSRALQLAYDALDVGTSTLVTLDQQGELIARQRRAIAHVHAKLDESDRLLRGMSLTGAMANIATSKPTSVEEADAAAAAEISYSTLLQIPIVNRSVSPYAPARLVFTDSSLCLIDGDVEADDDGTKTLVTVCRYSGIEDINVLVEPYHLRLDLSVDAVEDNAAKPKGSAYSGTSLLLVSAYLEDIILELGERSVVDIPLTIAPGSSPLSHKTAFYASSPAFTSSRRRDKNGASSSSSPSASSPAVRLANPDFRPLPKEVFMPMSDTEAALQDRQRQQQALMDAEDAQLEEMSHVLDDLKAVATTMGQTLDRQNAALAALDDDVASAQAHMNSTTKKVIRKL